MSFRPNQGIQLARTFNSLLTKRWAHRKANIQVKLNAHVEGIGIKDEVVSVRPGQMRNFLYPQGKASYIPTHVGPRDRKEEDKVRQDQAAAQAQSVSNLETSARQRQESAGHLKTGLKQVKQLLFKRAVVPGGVHTFGSVTAEDLVNALKTEYDLHVERDAIQFMSEGGRIKSLGDHSVQVQTGDALVEIRVSVEAA